MFADILKTPAAQSLARRLENGGALFCAGVAAPAQPFFAAILHKMFPLRAIVVVTENLKAQESFEQDLEIWLAAPEAEGQPAARRNVLFYPPWEVLPHEGKLPHADVIGDRLRALLALAGGAASGESAPIIVTSPAALMQRTFAPSDLNHKKRWLRRGDRIAPLDLIEWLEERGYEPEAQVAQRGEIALRGGIVDIFPPSHPWPVRLEFFGDELESLREFDPLTQVSRGEISEITIPPAGELGILRTAEATGTAAATLADYLSESAIFILCEPEELTVHAAEYQSQIPAGDSLFISWNDFQKAVAGKNISMVSLSEGVSEGPSTACDLRFQSLESFRPMTDRVAEPHVAEAQRREFFTQLHRWLRQNYSVHVFCNNDGERQRFMEIWNETTRLGSPSGPPGEHRLALHIGSLSAGFLGQEQMLVVVTDAEIFGRYKVQRPRRLRSPRAAPRSDMDGDFTSLDEGDLVVHLQYGIGRFLGLKSLPDTGKQQGRGAAPATECMVIEYAASEPGAEPPKLYVPMSEAHLVGKYIGVGRARPPLNTLGGVRWRKAKEQAERAVRDIAAELLRIQAARESQPGHAFKPDTAWQREFESAFIYQETPDQLAAIAATKADMEKPKPMDRLICGDVGFGKTEVAIRAAFKTVMDGRQAAVLAPTTVLAQQHLNTFRERMADYPIRIEMLSRFRTRREQQKTIAALQDGSVDIVIGTHRLLQDDIAFKDLGLVVIDEEQRFGVLHKEKFKRLRTLVDVLTLSATPIPRTLYLALSGARDMSAIQTPPHDRLPVETIAAPYDERLIRDAIQKEINRGGQVFFLHNRVMTIETVRAKLRQLVPAARIVVGHGQMDSDQLETVMTDFVNGRADVLLSTTIIESGLDIPNANTIIIDRADRFGLSDLYQLRGRVGRYRHQAYAYLLLPRHARLLTDVRKRISAIRQYSTLGSGFKIAMRDLEIRGAGNLLGAEQSGHIAAVGFELYCQIIKQSVASLKGQTVKPRVDVAVRLDFLDLNDAQGKSGACLPTSYISEPRHRIEFHRKIAQAVSKADLERARAGLRDRFGPLPPPAELLFQLAEVKILAAEKSVSEIEGKDDKLMLLRRGDLVMPGGKFPRLTKKDAGGRLKEIKKLLLAICEPK
ncbi:MAG: transcription-repair coupling factor [Verrucomicrobia bacterium]|nr:transcription-repair coupling factor [Verrucomicrobiota bacterium]MDE3099379.1 transcription-repair coupling factor [Verrucomicrobiota bacterium]